MLSRLPGGVGRGGQDRNRRQFGANASGTPVTRELFAPSLGPAPKRREPVSGGVDSDSRKTRRRTGRKSATPPGSIPPPGAGPATRRRARPPTARETGAPNGSQPPVAPCRRAAHVLFAGARSAPGGVLVLQPRMRLGERMRGVRGRGTEASEVGRSANRHPLPTHPPRRTTTLLGRLAYHQTSPPTPASRATAPIANAGTGPISAPIWANTFPRTGAGPTPSNAPRSGRSARGTQQRSRGRTGGPAGGRSGRPGLGSRWRPGSGPPASGRPWPPRARSVATGRGANAASPGACRLRGPTR